MSFGYLHASFNLVNSFIIMMKGKIILPLVTIMTLTLALISSSYSVAWADSDKDFCYDQVGDDHFCFTTKQKCKHQQ